MSRYPTTPDKLFAKSKKKKSAFDVQNKTGPDYTPGYSGVSQFGSNGSADPFVAAWSAGAATCATYPNGPDYTTAAGSSSSYDNDDTEI